MSKMTSSIHQDTSEHINMERAICFDKKPNINCNFFRTQALEMHKKLLRSVLNSP